jgi:hypothetical protein
MLYNVRMVYRITVDAETSHQAHRIVCDQIRAEPGLVISGVERFREDRPKKGVIYRLIFGY